MHHPWRRLGSLTSWTLAWADLPDGLDGLVRYADRMIILRRGMTQAERRSTLAHELIHAERGPVLDVPALVAREETAVEAEAARRLITVTELAEALAWTSHPGEAADELWVDQAMLRARLAHLRPAERRYLRRRLAS